MFRITRSLTPVAESGSGVEWYEHVVFYNDENGYTQECMYGNYFERMMMMRKVFRDESDVEDESHDERIPGLISRRSHRLIGEAMNGEVLSSSTNKKWCHQIQKYRFSSNGVGHEMILFFYTMKWEKREKKPKCGNSQLIMDSLFFS